MASSKRAGVTAERVAAPPFYSHSPLFDEKEKATILYADRVTRGAAGIRSSELQELRKFYGEGQIVELTLAVCVANFTNRFNDALQIVPELGV
jgi:alkylhydroperoxidase family enzyme